MRLVYLGSTDFPQPKARAIQIVNTCHALARAGTDVTLLVGRRGSAPPSRGLARYGLRSHPRLRIVAVPILRIPPTAPPALLRRFTRVWQISYLIGLAAVLPREFLRARPDIVFSRDLRTARLTSGLNRRLGVKLAFEVHGLPSYELTLGARRTTSKGSEAGRLHRLEETVFARASHVVTITERARAILIQDYAVPPEKVTTVPDGTQAVEGTTRPHPSPLPEEKGVLNPLSQRETVGVRASAPLAYDESTNSELPAVYYVGQLYPWKGADLFVDLASTVADARFVVVGGLSSKARVDASVEELAERARCSGTAARVELRGYVPYSQVRSELRNAAVAVLPLPDEPVARLFTSPLKLFDYMAAGVPIVASDLPSVREVLRHEENALLAPPGDRKAFAQAVERLIRDPALACRLSEQALHDVATYSWDARASRLIDFLATDPVGNGA